MLQQKIDCMDNNPIKLGFGTRSEDWKYSGARNPQNDCTVLEIDEIGFLSKNCFIREFLNRLALVFNTFGQRILQTDKVLNANKYWLFRYSN